MNIQQYYSVKSSNLSTPESHATPQENEVRGPGLGTFDA